MDQEDEDLQGMDTIENPFEQTNDNMFNEEFQVSNAPPQPQRKNDRSNSSSFKRRGGGDENYDNLAKQIEGISHLLKNLNSYVQKSPLANDKK